MYVWSKEKIDKRSPLEVKWHHGEAYSYDEWNALGYYVKAGMKASNIKGQKVFTREQVDVKKEKKSGSTSRFSKRSFSAGLDWDEMNEWSSGPYY